MHLTRRLTVLALALAPVATGAQEAASGGISVEKPWMRAAVQGGTGGAFLTLRNAGNAADRLVSASSPAARAAELHTSLRDGDVMRMQPVSAVEVPPGGSVTLQPGGLHIMLVGLAQAAKPGTSVPLTLNFEHAGPVVVQVPVLPVSATGPAGPMHQP